ncbi:TPA: hypothetical protein ACHS9P_000491 [Enterobacter roggenkampii]
MSTITKEWLQQKIADMEAARDEIPFGLDEDDSNTLAAMKLALASLEAEAVCVIDQSNLDYLKSGSDADVWPASRTEMGDVLLYRTTPPVPVSVPDLKPVGFLFVSDDGAVAYSPADWPMEGFNLIGQIYGDVNACRAAMLQGAENAESTTTIQTAPALDSSPKIAESTSGNSPVIPDGLNIRAVAALREAVRNQWLKSDDFADRVYWKSMHDIANEIVSAMLAAAPQQEAKNV